MQGGVRKRGKVWYYYFNLGKFDGKRKIVERKAGSTKKEAQAALRKALEEYENCGSVFEVSDITVSDYFDYWYKEYVDINCKHNTKNRYKTIIEKHIKPALGIYKLKSLNSNVLQKFLNAKYKEGYAKNTLSNYYGVLSSSLGMAVHPYKLLKENPMQYVKMPKYQHKKKNEDDLKIISMEDFNRIIERFPKESNFYLPLQIAFNTGMRAAEVCGLTWDCVDLKNNIIEVEKIIINVDNEWVFSTPKTNSSIRKIKIGKSLITVLKYHRKYQLANKLKYGQYYTNSDFVCTKENGELITTDSLKYLSKVVNYDLGINFNFHSLRHTHATMLLEADANIKDIQERLGHSKLATTMDTYSHVTRRLRQDSVDKFENFLSQIR